MDMLCLDHGVGRTRCGTKARIATAHGAVVSYETSAMLLQQSKTPVAHARASSARTDSLLPPSRLHLIA
jgi:hypothetical protein